MTPDRLQKMIKIAQGLESQGGVASVCRTIHQPDIINSMRRAGLIFIVFENDWGRIALTQRGRDHLCPLACRAAAK